MLIKSGKFRADEIEREDLYERKESRPVSAPC